MKSTNDKHPYSELDKPDTNNATFIPWFEVRGTEYRLDESINMRAYYKRLDEYNSGVRNGEWTHDEYWTYRDTQDMMEALCSQLNLTNQQMKAAVQEAGRVDFKRAGQKKSWILFAICSKVVHSTPQSVRKCHPNNLERDEVFKKVQRELGLSEKRFNRIYQQFGERQSKAINNDPVEYDQRDMDNVAYSECLNWGVNPNEGFSAGYESFAA